MRSEEKSIIISKQSFMKTWNSREKDYQKKIVQKKRDMKIYENVYLIV